MLLHLLDDSMAFNNSDDVAKPFQYSSLKRSNPFDSARTTDTDSAEISMQRVPPTSVFNLLACPI